jgi:hypothetical protein
MRPAAEVTEARVHLYLSIDMAVPVQLHVYDLSNGMARQMSRQLTGRQIDGIWYEVYASSYLSLTDASNLRHTSVVVFGKEIFYGQGINLTQPGRSHVRYREDDRFVRLTRNLRVAWRAFASTRYGRNLNRRTHI